MLTMEDIIDDSNKKIREVSKEVPLPLSDEDRDLLFKMHEFLVNSRKILNFLKNMIYVLQ